MNRFWLFYLFLGISFLILIGAVGFYIYHFGTHFSDKKEEWGQFGDFLNVFVSICNLVVVTSLTFIVFKIQQSEQRVEVRPYLIFKVLPQKKIWAVKNVGRGVALNVLITNSQEREEWDVPVKIYSLMPEEVLEITWFGPSIQCRGVYFDIHENVYTSTCENDETSFVENFHGLSNFKKNYKRLEEVSDPGVQFLF